MAAERAEFALAKERQAQQVLARSHVRQLRKANSPQIHTLFQMHKEKAPLLAISQHLRMAPCLVARVFLEFSNKVPKANIYKALLATLDDETAEHGLSGRLRAELRACVVADVHCSPLCDRIRRSEGDEYEHMMILRLHQLGIPFENEHMLRERGLAKTPDALLLAPIQVRTRDGRWHLVQWIDSKAMAHESATENEAQHIAQAHAYVNRFGPGMLLYWMGVEADVATIPDVLMVDHIPSEIRMPGITASAPLTLSDGTSFSTQDGHIRREFNADGVPCSYVRFDDT
ncbi:hypothetical protein SPRG_03173 [Saprolegnia parasitica CBS 223.65]|uniref:CDAN1-interacting nuclease 1 n=1 Tax=Saprolegnia parasitica (strain CBS 223.65) TaxID=695850 RepID=A0A067CN66_SAPPC|nr:hypothetical protein SPRG_03173 [Saprolegnia parasitica CBS 223.65]KDO31958.1 hypothetical protein SPRG_03173 [Saprolegnia parasitica CBS 223.65]|eukprot:XP_012197155.1 hypothetical protein SPRG_03173 [Saprolegnia parasitica CBS 223.65]